MNIYRTYTINKSIIIQLINLYRILIFNVIYRTRSVKIAVIVTETRRFIISTITLK